MGTTVRSSSRNPSNRGFSSHRIFLSAILTLLFIATLSAFLTSTAPNQDPIDTSLHNRPSLDPGPVRTYVSRTFLALKSDPLRTRLDLIYKQASDHIALINAYGAYARKLKLDNSKQLKIFEDLADNFSDLDEKSPYKRSLIETDGPMEEDVLRQYEKEVKDRIKTARQVIAEAKESFDNQIKIQKLKDTIFAVNEQLAKAKKHGTVSSLISARSIPKSLHCLAMRLVEERAAHPEKYSPAPPPEDEFEDPSLFHYAIFSNNVIATSVVVNSAVRNAEEPGKHVFHVVTDRMYLAAMQVWFKMRPAEGGAHVEVKAAEDFSFLNASYVPVIGQLEAVAESDEAAAAQGSPVHVSMLEYLRFYLPEMYPKLRRILLLDDDVVVQRDLTGLWRMDMDGKVNGAVETCFGSFHRYSQYLNFSHPKVRERFNPKACAWAYGMNLFDLDAWRGEECTEEYHYWQKLNENRTLWKSGTLPPGLITFYSTTKPLDKSWHVLGLGYNPSISMDEINNAAVIHYNGNMKPWLDIAMNQFKHLWTKYVDYDMEFVQMCNFGL
ncbi:hypothetical protein MRB53_023333 [Persea americana]|uniref:Uncharacterized protein n=1 Tax=Persea americana TaxID=3435 RepID=A0ACC2L9G7_PERAE|nr:hypothetical protein MRB53_023333 [Persea americana]